MMNLDQRSWLVHRLCGRQGAELHREDFASSSKPTSSRHGGTGPTGKGAMLRTPGTLAEVVVQRVKSDREETLEDEAQRLSMALMSLQSGGAGNAAGHPFHGGVMEDRGALSTPLVRQYDDVSARQHARLTEQQREVEEMRRQMQSLQATSRTLAGAEASSTGRYDLIQGSGEGDCEELVSRVTSYAKENELLKEQLALTALELKHLHGDLETRTHNVIVLKHEVQRLKENELTLKNSFADVLREAKHVHSRAHQSSERSQQAKDAESLKLETLRAEASEWQTRAANAELEHSRLRQELQGAKGQLDHANRTVHQCRAELSDAKDYAAVLETRLRAHQMESLEVYKQVKEAMAAAEHAAIQRDQAFVRERALADEVKRLQQRVTDNAGKVDAHVMKLLRKTAAATAEDLRSTKNKLMLSEGNNSELRAEAVSKLNEINRLNNMKARETHAGVSREESAHADVDDVPLRATAARQTTRRHQAHDARMQTAEKGVEQRLKQTEEMLEAQQNLTLAMETDAARTIQVLREKLRRSRQMQSALSKQLNKASFSAV